MLHLWLLQFTDWRLHQTTKSAMMLFTSTSKFVCSSPSSLGRQGVGEKWMREYHVERCTPEKTRTLLLTRNSVVSDFISKNLIPSIPDPLLFEYRSAVLFPDSQSHIDFSLSRYLTFKNSICLILSRFPSPFHSPTTSTYFISFFRRFLSTISSTVSFLQALISSCCTEGSE